MAFCQTCGGLCDQTVEFCGKCGASRVPGVLAAANVLAPIGNTTGAPENEDPAMAANIAGALCYLFGVISGIVFLVLQPFRRNRFVRFHAWQSIYFTVVWVVLAIAWTTVITVFEAITAGFLAVLIIPVGCLLTLAGIGYWVFLMYRAYSGEESKVPLLGQLAHRHASR
jgi:uncharacterized membrane protein